MIFQERSDKAHQKCIAEQEHPIKEQPGAVQCQRCERWFRSEGGLAVHKSVCLSSLHRPPIQSVVNLSCVLFVMELFIDQVI